MIFVAVVPTSAIAMEANSNRFSVCLATPHYKRWNGTSDASKTSEKRSMNDSEFQSQAIPLEVDPAIHT
jgi:hypothetical protein